MQEKSRLPDRLRVALATLLGYENDRSITSCGIDDRLRTSRIIPTTSTRNGETRQPEFRVHRIERAWIQNDVDEMT